VSDLLSFAKYEAVGNDFIIVEDLGNEFQITAERASSLCDRWFGVGADGLIRVTRGTVAPYAMDLTNADGSHAEMSGNGIRCLAGYLHDNGRVDDESFDVETPAGIRRVSLEIGGGSVTGATVSMGAPIFAKSAIPMRGPAWETFLGQPFDIGGGVTATASAISMGNPHLVLFVDEDPERFHLEHLGPMLERHELFPERTNVELARIGSDGAIEVRVWERGVGETLSCGTGACAVVVAANETGIAGPDAAVRFRGGTLRVERTEDGKVLLAGPVTHVFDGTVDLSKLGEDAG
jgi:diaminopimelate epimerase